MVTVEASGVGVLSERTQGEPGNVPSCGSREGASRGWGAEMRLCRATEA